MTVRFPEEDNVQANLLRYLVSRDKIDEAEAFLREKVAAAPEDDDAAFVNLLQFLLQLRSQEAAMNELDAAISSRPDAYTLRAMQASLRFDAGERDAAIASMQEIVDTVSETRDTVTEKEFENLRLALANMLARNGNDVGARRIVEEILAENPEMTGALKMQARWFILDDDTEGAINAMRLVLAKEKQDYEAMTIMAEAFQRAGKHDLMLDFLSQATEASTYNSPEQALRYASALQADDKLLQAENILITSLRIQPNNIDVLTALGRIYLDLKDTARAQQVADKRHLRL